MELSAAKPISPPSNLAPASRNKRDMTTVLAILFVILCGYGAYRAIRGGFQRSQSERLTGYGIIGIAVIVIVVIGLFEKLFG